MSRTVDWRRTRMVRLPYDESGNVAQSYNELMATGAAYGHGCTIASIGEYATVLDVRLTTEGIVILYVPVNDMRRAVV